MRTARLLPYLPACTAPGGGVPARGGYLVLEGVPGVGGGVYLALGEGCTCPGTLPVDRMTDTCKNITFANFVCGR